MGSTTGVDQALLLGLLAIRERLIEPEMLSIAVTDWIEDGSCPLEAILLRRGVLTAGQADRLVGQAAEFLQGHEGDARAALADLGPNGPARDIQTRAPDAGPRDLLDLFPESPPTRDPYATRDSDTDPERPGVGSAAPPADSPWARTARFRALSLHARGGLGEVFLARDEELSREVALKQIQDRHADHEASRLRFEAEARITGSLEHPGIVPVYGFGYYPDGRPFYAMRFIRGDSLKEAIDQFHRPGGRPDEPGPRSLEFRKLLGRFVAACNAVAYAHGRGVVHRDLKPGNIMLGPYGETLVVDWGLAKATGEAGDDSPELPVPSPPSDGSAATVPGQAVGTPQYMSPEQAEGAIDRVGPVSDVYSLGATLYTLLTGRCPFDETDLARLLERVGANDVVPPRQVEPTTPPGLQAVCLKAMALRAEDRYPTATALAEDIEHWLADEPLAAYPEPWTRRLARWARRHRAWVRAGLAALVSIAVVSVAALIVVDGARQAEVKARKAEGLARLDEKTQRRLAESRLVETRVHLARSTFAQAQAYFRQGEVDRGILGLARGLAEAPGEADAPDHRPAADLRRALRLNLRAWQRQVHRKLGELPAPPPWSEIAFAPDGRTIVVVPGRASAVQRFDAATAQPAGEVALPGKIAAVDPECRVLVLRGPDETLSLYDLPGRRPIGEPIPRTSPKQGATFSLDGRVVTVRSEGKPMQVFDARDGRRLGELPDPGPKPDDRKPPGRVRFADLVDWPVLAASPDRGRLLIWDREGVFRLLDGELRPVGEPIRHEGVPFVYRPVFGPDGKLVITLGINNVVVQAADNLGEARAWDATTGRPVGSPMRHDMAIFQARFSPDGRTLATAGLDHVTRLWDPKTGRMLGSPLLQRGSVYAADFGPDGDVFLSGGAGQEAILWDVARARPVGAPIPNGNQVMRAAFSPDGGRALIWGGPSGRRVPTDRPALWELGLPRPIARTPRLPDAVEAIAFRPDGRAVALAVGATYATRVPILPRKQGEARYHDVEAGRLVDDPPRDPTGLGMVRGRVQLWLRDGDQIVDLWTLDDAKPECLAFSRDGRMLLAADSRGRVRIFDGATGRPLIEAIARRVPGSPGEVELYGGTTGRPEPPPDEPPGRPDPAVGGRAAKARPANRPPVPVGIVRGSFRADGRAFLLGFSDGAARLYDVAAARPAGPTSRGSGTVKGGLGPDGSSILVAEDGGYRVRDALSLEPRGERFVTGNPVNEVTFGPDGRTLLLRTTRGREWCDLSGRRLDGPIARDGVEVFALGPDDRHVATLAAGGTVQVRDGRAGRPIGRPLLHGGLVRSVAISPDGRLALVGTGDTTTDDRGLTYRGEAHLWDIATGQPVGPVAEFPDHVTDVAFSPDGSTYILASYHGPAQLRETPTPMPGDAARIADEASLATGLRFDADDMIVTLDDPTRRDIVRRRSGESGR